MEKRFYVYIMANKHNNVIYTGITNDLKRRVYEHKLREKVGFTSKYRINKLVYYESFESVNHAISREKQIKAGSRRKKLLLVNGFNEDWIDLAYFI